MAITLKIASEPWVMKALKVQTITPTPRHYFLVDVLVLFDHSLEETLAFFSFILVFLS